MAEHSLFVIAAIALTLVADAYVNAAMLPKEIEICKRNDEECLFRSIPKALRIIKAGIPKLGVLPTDPLKITEMVLNQGHGPLQINMNLFNQELGGLSTAVITYTKGDFTGKNFRMEIRGNMPVITLNGDYKASERVLLFPVHGDGKNNFTLDNVSATMLLIGHTYEQDGEQYVQLDKVELKLPIVKRLHLKFTNLFNGEKTLNENMNRFFNDNWEPILNELKPSIEEAISQVLAQVVSRVYGKVPYTIIHPVS